MATDFFKVRDDMGKCSRSGLACLPLGKYRHCHHVLPFFAAVGAYVQHDVLSLVLPAGGCVGDQRPR